TAASLGVIELKNGGDGERGRREEICAANRRKSESESAAEEEIWRRREERARARPKRRYLILRKQINVKVLVE
ncbi:hypothetical protein, partial [Escherichia coli]|uniref:hypothetical protein n=1 Tax=Escherichia coli TaxID=562 RepID=UPI0032DA064C